MFVYYLFDKYRFIKYFWLKVFDNLYVTRMLTKTNANVMCGLPHLNS